MIKINLSKKTADTIFVCIIIAAVLLIIQAFTGQWFWKNNPYNSYVLQVQSWLDGRLDLGMDYPYLELAIYNGKYYVSFPPFPSYVILPFAALGFHNCDGLIAFISSITAGAYAVKIMHCLDKSRVESIFWALFVTIGSNWLFTASTPWVWFIAQNMAFTLSMMAIYYALKNKIGLSLAFWACSVGCRPFQAIYIVVLIYIIYGNLKKENPSITVFGIIKKKWYCTAAAFLIAVSYMALNYVRFGNILEFGHNYLPEFTHTAAGQFNIAYLKENIPKLFRLPTVNNGRLEFQSADGFCIFIASPIFISYTVYFVRSLADKAQKRKAFLLVLFALLVLHLFMITLHRTMGGSHYGNRYTNDTLPFVYLSLAYMIPSPSSKWNYIPLIAGFLLNAIWSFMYFG